jgi:hypothetical protein
VLAFSVPLVFSSWLEPHHDVYYLVYFATIGAVLAVYLVASDINLTEVVFRSWKRSLMLGVASGAFVTWSVVGRIDSTPHPAGAYFAFEILWRGLVHGIADASLLTAFPCLIAWELMQRNIAGLARSHQLWRAHACSRRNHHGDVPRRVQGPAERHWDCAAGDRQHHHLRAGDCVRQSRRVGRGARIHASGGSDAFVRE